MSRPWSPVRGCRRRVLDRFSPGEGYACMWGDPAGVMLPCCAKAAALTMEAARRVD